MSQLVYHTTAKASSGRHSVDFCLAFLVIAAALASSALFVAAAAAAADAGAAAGAVVAAAGAGRLVAYLSNFIRL